MKYKVGDKVRVRRDLDAGKDYGKRAVVPEMTNLKGMIATIKSVGRDYYELEEDIDLFDWTDEMIEGLWEENKPKYKLIDTLNKIANGELKEGTIIKWNNAEYEYKYMDFARIDCNGKIYFLCEDMRLNELNDEVELIEPNHFPDVGNTLEPTDNTKIEELNVKGLCEIFEGKHTVNPNLAFSTALNKLNEVIRYINK